MGRAAEQFGYVQGDVSTRHLPARLGAEAQKCGQRTYNKSGPDSDLEHLSPSRRLVYHDLDEGGRRHEHGHGDHAGLQVV